MSSVVLLLMSCKKEDGDDGDSPGTSEFYMEFREDGVMKAYRSNEDGRMQANFNEFSGADQYVSTFVGWKYQPDLSTNNITALISDSVMLMEGVVYTNSTSPGLGEIEAALMTLGYFDENGDFFNSLAVSIFSGFTADAKIKITEVTSTYYEAEFSGTVYNIDYTQSRSITEGKIRAERY